MPKLTPERDRTEFGRRMRLARERAGLTQEQAAAQAGVAQSTVVDAETKNLSSRKVTQFAVLYRVDPDWLATAGATELGEQMRV